MGHAGTPLPTLCDPLAVAKTGHQLGPSFRRAYDVPSLCLGLVRKPEAGLRGNDDVQRVLNCAAVRGRVGEWPDNLEELHHRPWPSMGQDDRQGVLMLRFHMDEVNAEPVDLSAELWIGVDALLEVPPVVFALPISDKRLRLLKRYALGPVRRRFLLRPAGVLQPLLEVVDRRLPHGHTERLDVFRSRRNV